MKGLKDKVLVSHSDNDKDSEYFEMFRTQSEYKVLVAVDRGKLGYNLPDLFNVVDFTLTQSLDMILQMMGRILRLSDKDKQKTYFKVATKNTAGYFVDLMTGALCLFTNDSPTYYYSSFNGKNMGGILIPKVLTKSTKSGQKSTQSTNTKKATQQLKSLEELGIPLDLNLFKQDIMYSQSDKFGTIAWTTLDDVRREFFGIMQQWDLQKAHKEALKYKSRWEFGKNSGAYGWALRNNCLDKICSHMTGKWNLELAKKEAKKYKTIGEVQRMNPSLSRWVLKNNLKDKVYLHMNFRNEWTEERVREEAKKYSKRVDFQNAPGKAYRAAQRLGILEEVCSHMVQNKRWTIEEIKKLQKGFKYDIDFRKAHPQAHNAAIRFGLRLKMMVK
jgi:DNA-binding HxlR family transcriptional regulator